MTDLADGRLKLRHLRYVVAIAEQGSLVAAGERLHITQPVLTRGLRELESILKVELFERSPRGMTATLFGEVFVDHARAVLAELRQAGRHLEELVDGHAGTVTIGTFLAGASVLLPRAVARVKTVAPDLTVVIRHGGPEALYEALLAGDVDLVVGTLEPANNDRLRQHHLYYEPARVVARSQHPAHRRPGLTIADLIGELWSLPPADNPQRRQLEEHLLSRGLSTPANRIECGSFLAVRAIALETDTLVVMPQLVAETEPELAALPIDLGIVESVGVTLPAGRQLTPTMLLMMRKLDEAAAEIRAAITSYTQPA
ncbi:MULTISPECIES: LysR substrate-binding domain-containing protein [Amycolatopsis]|uniref:LysR family transcriptional regulator n=1 Tax=Amycolatopsis dendrobii TaxID=2760662 RepID=A0A7W3VWR1_9PSEU|nr:MULTISPECIES: LysR substrate-binding domain-containing protein [Amycolatopsis]MBB1154429.1 LysR family transcriptional regulator [Amycolatopsis dendrobii]UKD51195.1 LysR substrate-binding domain-containing protein [Amycolatopsis sp. FU40]